MTVLEQAVSKMQQLPIDQQQKVLRFIEFLAFELDDRQVPQNNGISIAKEASNLSCYELTQKWIGIADDLPDDLSVNKNYMNGYGV